MHLQVYSADCGLSDDQASADYKAWEPVRSAWREQYGHLPIVEQPPGDDRFCGELDEHDCRGADCPRRSAT